MVVHPILGFPACFKLHRRDSLAGYDEVAAHLQKSEACHVLFRL